MEACNNVSKGKQLKDYIFLNANPELKHNYLKFMNENMELGHMEKVPAAEIDSTVKYFLPHHAVLKPDSSTTKLRIVFDASAKTSTEVSLNDVLKVGSTVQQSLRYE